MGSYGCHVTLPMFQLSPAPLRHLYEAENGFFIVGLVKWVFCLLWLALVLAVLNSGVLFVAYRLVVYVTQHYFRGKKDQ